MSLSSSSQVRVRFVTAHEEYSVSDAPFALPARLGRQGLSEVVNHLLGLEDDAQHAFDFLINNVLVRSPLYKFLTQHRLSAENVIEIVYFPAVTLSEESQKVELPAWVGSLQTHEGIGFAGSYDGSLKAFDVKSLNVVASIDAHVDPVRALTVIARPQVDGVSVATASKDNTIKIWKQDSNCFAQTHLLSGHINSVESICQWNVDDSQTLVLSGDWSGNLLAWKVDELKNGSEEQPAKKKKDSKGKSEATKVPVQQTGSLFSIKAHSQSLSSFATSKIAGAHVFTASWDHSIKEWDLNRQDCVHTVNCSKVVTSIDMHKDADAMLLASSHVDGRVRIWDQRQKSSGADSALSFGKTTNWISQVRWNPTGTLFAATDFSGSLVMWDLRSSVPLSNNEDTHAGKALCLWWTRQENAEILSGGSDCCIRSTKIVV